MNFSKIVKTIDAFKNIFDKKYSLVYVAETNNWIIKWVGGHLTRSLNKKNLIKSRVSLSSFGLKNKIIHFGSINSFMKNGLGRAAAGNKIIFSWFHIVVNDERLKYIEKINVGVDFLLTSCQATKKSLILSGLRSEKIVVIPLGVDLKNFKALSLEKKKEIKNNLGLSPDKIVIGSFQKDGNGWGEGLEPKLIKGPDVFCDAVIELAQKYPIQVLLTGPARGYVKKRLKAAGIPYVHKILKYQEDLADFYSCLDLYIIGSRIEGGPESLLEAWATGVPVVSTRMGMPADIVRNGENGLLAEVEDVSGLVAAAEMILSDQALRNKITDQALKDVKKYSWDILAEEYYDKIYKKL